MKTINRAIGTYTSPAEWLEFVKSLRILAPTKASKTVPDVTLIIGKKTIVRVARTPKQITEPELALLAVEHGKEVGELRELLTKRKIILVNEAGEQTNAKPKRVKASQANAGDKPRRRKANSKSELLEPRADADMQPQGLLQPKSEAQ